MCGHGVQFGQGAILQYSNTPSLHHSITPSLHHSITPSLRVAGFEDDDDDEDEDEDEYEGRALLIGLQFSLHQERIVGAEHRHHKVQ
jgi:hypothetical protein